MMDYFIMIDINKILGKNFSATVLNKYIWTDVEITKKQIKEIETKYPDKEFMIETKDKRVSITINLKKENDKKPKKNKSKQKD